MGAPYISTDKIIEPWSAAVKLMIIDTVDYYILCIDRSNIAIKSIFSTEERHSNISSVFSKVCKIYEEIDIPIDKLETPFDVTAEQFKMITDICGKNISIHKDSEYGSKNDISFQKLLIDLSKIIEFTKIQMFWNDRKKLVEKINSNLKHIDEENKMRNFSDFTKDFNNSSTEDLETSVEGFSKLDCIYKNINEKDNITNCDDISNLPIYIMYNSLYNISLLVNESCYTVKLIENDFPEFTVIDKFIDMSDVNKKNIHTFFHKRTFESIDNIKEKIQSFRVLYDIKDNTGLYNDYSEKEEIVMIMNKLYEQNTNPSDKIKANEIYTRIEFMSKPETRGNLAFRKRVARYLIDIGLTRKRLSDGIYYYGLIEKTINNTLDNLETIEEKRRIDEELYKPPPPNKTHPLHPLVIVQENAAQQILNKILNNKDKDKN